MSQSPPSIWNYSGPYKGKVILREYIHGSHDEYYDWEVDDDGNELYVHDLHSNLHYLNYEVPVDVEVDFDTGSVKVVAFWDGGTRFVPEG